jgi:hypothetical protein
LVYVDRKSKLYENEDMAVELYFGILEVNWKARQMARFFRFVRYNKYKTDAYRQQFEGFQNRQQEQSKSHTFKDCSTDKETIMSLRAVF